MTVRELIRLAEIEDIELYVHRGNVLFNAPTQPQAQTVLEQIIDRQDEVKKALLAERGADVASLIELWRSDPGLREEFNSIANLDDFAHVSGIRLLRSVGQILQKFR